MALSKRAPNHERFEIAPEWVSASGCFLDQLERREREELLGLAKVRNYRKGAILFRAGIKGNMVYILESGRVKISQLSTTGREMILWFCLPGELFGLASVPSVGPRLVYAQACTEARVHCIARADFLNFIRGNANVSGELINLLLGRLYVLCDALLNASSECTEDRLLRLLSRLRHQYGRPVGDELCLDIPLTQQEIADMIGSSRQTVSVLLNRMKQRGSIRVAQRRLFLRSARN